MPAPAAALELARRWEGLRLHAYLCPARVWTIGYGHAGPDVARGLVWTVRQALDALQVDMDLAHADATALCPSLAEASCGRQAALADFVYNLGPGRLKASTLRRKVNEGAWDDVPAELRKWVWGGGRKLPGLILRREAEIALL
jgi:lysozyme